MVFYHGSDTPNIEHFSTAENRTAYGLFFTPDPMTARTYGRHLYRVHLNVRNLADLDDPTVLRAVAQQDSWEEPVRMARDRYGQIVGQADPGDLRATLYRIIQQAQGDPSVRRVLSRWMDSLEIPEEERWGADLADVLEWEQPEEDDEIIDAVFRASPTLRAEYNEAHPMRSSEVFYRQQAYGSQEFYMNYQDSMMRTARSMGYDGVAFTDPSSSGRPESWVVFDGSQVCILGMEDL
jgi:hypothetical protein